MCEADWSTASGTRDLWFGSPPQNLDTGQKLMGAPREAGGRTEEPGRGPDMALPELQTRGPSRAPPRLIPAPDSPPLSVQLPPVSTVGDVEQPSAPFDRNCAPSQAPASGLADYDQLS